MSNIFAHYPADIFPPDSDSPRRNPVNSQGRHIQPAHNAEYERVRDAHFAECADELQARRERAERAEAEVDLWKRVHDEALSDIRELKAENQRHRRAALVQAVVRYDAVDEWIAEVINAEGFDRVPWVVAERLAEENRQLRARLIGSSCACGHLKQ